MKPLYICFLTCFMVFSSEVDNDFGTLSMEILGPRMKVGSFREDLPLFLLGSRGNS